MTSRHRGAVIVFAVLALGRILDRFDLPFEHHPGNGMPADSTLVPADAPDARRPDADGPRVQEGPPAPGTAGTAPDTAAAARVRRDGAPPPTVVQVNRAAAADLQRLPGVGPVLAGRILEHRRTHGPFRDLADLQRVKGIGARTAARWSGWIRFD